MKTIIATIVVTLSLAASHAFAWDIPENPDRFPSVGLNMSNAALNGPRSEIDGPARRQRIQHGDESSDLHSLGADIRLPATQSLTFTVSYDHLEGSSHFEREGGIYKQSSNLDGYRWGFGMRLYFNK
jgi:hypothetical protein